MDKRDKQTDGFELCSEKVRSVVGQIPSSLTRYGITVISVVLLCLSFIACFLPYINVFNGSVTICSEGVSVCADTLEVEAFIRFDGKRPVNVDGQTICLELEGNEIRGDVLSVSAIRDTLERQCAVVRFASCDVEQIRYHTVDFYIRKSSGSLLENLLGCAE